MKEKNNPLSSSLEREIESWKDFKRALRQNKPIFDEIMKYPRHHSAAISKVSRLLMSDTLFMSISIGQEKRLEKLNERISRLKLEY